MSAEAWWGLGILAVLAVCVAAGWVTALPRVEFCDFGNGFGVSCRGASFRALRADLDALPAQVEARPSGATMLTHEAVTLCVPRAVAWRCRRDLRRMTAAVDVAADVPGWTCGACGFAFTDGDAEALRDAGRRREMRPEDQEPAAAARVAAARRALGDAQVEFGVFLGAVRQWQALGICQFVSPEGEAAPQLRLDDLAARQRRCEDALRDLCAGARDPAPDVRRLADALDAVADDLACPALSTARDDLKEAVAQFAAREGR